MDQKGGRVGIAWRGKNSRTRITERGKKGCMTNKGSGKLFYEHRDKKGDVDLYSRYMNLILDPERGGGRGKKPRRG